MSGAKNSELRDHLASILEYEGCSGSNVTANTIRSIRNGTIGPAHLMQIVKSMAQTGCGTQSFQNVSSNVKRGKGARLPGDLYDVVSIPKTKNSVFQAVAQGGSYALYHHAISEHHMKRIVAELRHKVSEIAATNSSVQSAIVKNVDPTYARQFHVQTGTIGTFNPGTYGLKMRENAMGGPGELNALAKILQMEIHVYVRNNASFDLVARYKTLEKSGRVHVIRLVTHNRHYDVLVQKMVKRHAVAPSKRSHFWSHVDSRLFNGEAGLQMTNGTEKVARKLANNRAESHKRKRLNDNLPSNKNIANSNEW